MLRRAEDRSRTDFELTLQAVLDRSPKKTLVLFKDGCQLRHGLNQIERHHTLVEKERVAIYQTNAQVLQQPLQFHESKYFAPLLTSFFILGVIGYFIPILFCLNDRCQFKFTEASFLLTMFASCLLSSVVGNCLIKRIDPVLLLKKIEKTLHGDGFLGLCKQQICGVIHLKQQEWQKSSEFSDKKGIVQIRKVIHLFLKIKEVKKIVLLLNLSRSINQRAPVSEKITTMINNIFANHSHDLNLQVNENFVSLPSGEIRGDGEYELPGWFGDRPPILFCMSNNVDAVVIKIEQQSALP